MIQNDDPLTMSDAKKDRWDKAKVIATTLTPIIVLLLGVMINATLKEQELNAAYVRVAVETLQTTDTTEASVALRRWALSILDGSSPVALPPRLRSSVLGIDLEGLDYRSAPRTGFPNAFIQLGSSPEENLYVLVDGITQARTPATINHPGVRPIVVDFQRESGETICSTSITVHTRTVKLVCIIEGPRVDVSVEGVPIPGTW